MHYLLYYCGSKIACFFCGADLVEFVERSVYAGCALTGWSVRFPNGKFQNIIVDVKIHF